DGNNASIAFLDVAALGTVCPEMPSPATADISLGDLASGNYTIQTRVNGQSRQLELEVTDSAYTLFNANGLWTAIGDSVIRRVQFGTVWAIVGYNNPQLLNVAQSFLNALDSIGALPHVYPAGDYSYFSVTSSGTVVLPPTNTNFYSTTIRQYPGDPLTLYVLVRNYANSYYPGLNIMLYDWEGDAFLSSQLKGQ
ncbi:MAG TPA: hypothetical protein VKS81_01160, partial [Bacteroidota bacterium]|nr:hypothetical protein [Bacteroidota bacterium]